jgi:hypothetical protein
VTSCNTVDIHGRFSEELADSISEWNQQVPLKRHVMNQIKLGQNLRFLLRVIYLFIFLQQGYILAYIQFFFSLPATITTI